jgi:alpha-amylase
MLNNTLIQFFHWYLPNDGTLWNKVAEQADYLSHLGITMAWLPPAYKPCEGGAGVGYGVYDLYDLGEFDQKGSVPTKYGNRDQYLKAIQALKDHHIKPMADIVLNHKCGGDETETIKVQDVDPNNRNNLLGEPYDREVMSRFTFLGRQGKYSDFIWDFTCFSGIDDFNDYSKFYYIHNEHGEGWEDVESKEFGNFDYLLGADVEFRNPHVKAELNKWGKWYLETAKFEGMRFDAVKHFSTTFLKEFIWIMKEQYPDMYIIAEYWTYNLEELLHYLESIEYSFKLFDAPLHNNFYTASMQGNEYDLRQIFDGSLLQAQPHFAITFVENHDTQPLQSLESPVDFWFKPLGYALILLREQGDPCVFYPTIFGAEYEDKGKDGADHHVILAPVHGVYEMLLVRKKYNHGMLKDYFDHPNTIGWVRVKEETHTAFAVVISNGYNSYKAMEVGSVFANHQFVDALKSREDEITIDENGWANFPVNDQSVAVWVLKEMRDELEN